MAHGRAPPGVVEKREQTAAPLDDQPREAGERIAGAGVREATAQRPRRERRQRIEQRAQLLLLGVMTAPVPESVVDRLQQDGEDLGDGQ
ncbi:MAG: hypothetical protein M3680_17990, partial [Myxococcota bacterium]|nr:hypothetical protein [Myxococcota bacterium]